MEPVTVWLEISPFRQVYEWMACVLFIGLGVAGMVTILSLCHDAKTVAKDIHARHGAILDQWRAPPSPASEANDSRRNTPSQTGGRDARR